MNWTDLLLEAKRKSQLTGTPLSSADYSSLVSEYTDQAAERLEAEREHELAQEELSLTEELGYAELESEEDIAALEAETQLGTTEMETASEETIAAGELEYNYTALEQAQSQFEDSLALEQESLDYQESYYDWLKEQAEEAEKEEEWNAVGTATGAVLGASIGLVATGGNPMGAAVGAQVGTYIAEPMGDLAEFTWDTFESGIDMFSDAFSSIGDTVGSVFGGCIIVTSCTNRDSYEVNVTREYRDRFLDLITLKGYYKLAKVVVPCLKFSLLRKMTKRLLVDRLIDYGEVALGKKESMKFKTSSLITGLFLGLCRVIGGKRCQV